MKMVQTEDHIRKGPWTEQEDLQLVCFVGLFGDRRWDFIAKVSGSGVGEDEKTLLLLYLSLYLIVRAYSVHTFRFSIIWKNKKKKNYMVV